MAPFAYMGIDVGDIDVILYGYEFYLINAQTLWSF